jgi:acyl-CoA thioesterase
VVRALLGACQPAKTGVLRSLSLSFLCAPRPGQLELEVQVLRAGQRATRCTLTALQRGEPVLAGAATFSAANLPVVAEWDVRPPAVFAPPLPSARPAAPGHYRPADGGWLALSDQLPPVIHRARLAPQFGHGRYSGAGNGQKEGPETGGWMMLRHARRIDLAYLAMCADLWWPAALEPVGPQTAAPTLELSIHFRRALPEGGLPREPILAHFCSRVAAEGIVDEDGALFLPDGALLAQVRQLSLLVATT